MVSFRHAVELPRADHPSLAAGEGRIVRKGTTPNLEAPVKAEADEQEALKQAASRALANYANVYHYVGRNGKVIWSSEEFATVPAPPFID